MRYLFLLSVLVLPWRPAWAGILEFADKDAWAATVGSYNTIDFTGLAPGTIVIDQYAEQGVVFTDGDDIALCCNAITWPNDGAGVDGYLQLSMDFQSLQRWIGTDFPGGVFVQLFKNGELVGSSGVGGAFVGLVGTAFDAAIIFGWGGGVAAIDDLYFGAPLPGDANNDTVVDVLDLIEVILRWGTCSPEDLCFTDGNGDGFVDVEDLVAVITNWS